MKAAIERFLTPHYIYVNSELKPYLNEMGLVSYNNFKNDDIGVLLRRDSYDREVRRLEVMIDGKAEQYFIKRVGKEPLTHSIRMLLWGRRPESSPMREVRLLSLLRDEGFSVMNVVGWGEERQFGFPVSGFLLAQKVQGDAVAAIYQELSMEKKRLLFKAIGNLVANLHLKGFFQQVRLTDLFASYETENGQDQFVLTLIDRETGKPWKSLFSKQKCINSLARTLKRTIKYNQRLGPNSIRHFTSGYLDVIGQRLSLSRSDLLRLVYKKLARHA